jgi:hypothetical protein
VFDVTSLSCIGSMHSMSQLLSSLLEESSFVVDDEDLQPWYR